MKIENPFENYTNVFDENNCKRINNTNAKELKENTTYQISN